MSRKKAAKPYWEMTTEELREATKEFDEEFVADKARRGRQRGREPLPDSPCPETTPDPFLFPRLRCPAGFAPRCCQRRTLR
jgi:hypothetical protein